MAKYISGTEGGTDRFGTPFPGVTFTPRDRWAEWVEACSLEDPTLPGWEPVPLDAAAGLPVRAQGDFLLTFVPKSIAGPKTPACAEMPPSWLLLGVACLSRIPPLTDLCCGLIVCNKLADSWIEYGWVSFISNPRIFTWPHLWARRQTHSFLCSPCSWPYSWLILWGTNISMTWWWLILGCCPENSFPMCLSWELWSRPKCLCLFYLVFLGALVVVFQDFADSQSALSFLPLFTDQLQ